VNGKVERKYLSPKNDPHRLYFGPMPWNDYLADVTAPAVIVEAEKSALAVTGVSWRAERPFLVIALGGCWGWRGETGKDVDAKGTRVDVKGAVPDLDKVTWERREVFLAFDSNAASNASVVRARLDLAAELTARGAYVRIVNTPAERGVNGPDDYIGAQGDHAFLGLLAKAESLDGDDDSDGRDGAARRLLRLIERSGIELFHDLDGEPYATVPVEGHRETYSLDSPEFGRWMRRIFYTDARAGVPNNAFTEILELLKARADCEGPRRQVALRVASHDTATYLDLANEDWQAVEITAAGWNITADPPVRFRRTPEMRELPLPVGGGNVDDLRPFINIAGDENFMLIVAFVMAALRSLGPYPVLCLTGEEGSAKSTTLRMLRRLIDPNKADLSGRPSTGEDLAIAADNAHLVGFDNVSGLDREVSDDICRLATGSGLRRRTLYQNRAQTVFSASRPIMINGIENFVVHGDLLSRAIIIACPNIPEKVRRREDVLWAEFEQIRPRILGALVSAMAIGLRRMASINVPNLPRMADFAHWGTAIEPAFGWPNGSFISAFKSNQSVSRKAIVEGDALAIALIKIAHEEDRNGTTGFEGTATALYQRLDSSHDGREALRKSRCENAISLGSRVRRLAPGLRHIGLDVDPEGRTASERRIVIRPVEKVVTPVMTVISPTSEMGADNGCLHEIASNSQPLAIEGPDGRDDNDRNDGNDANADNGGNEVFV
jgi:hypothetical protein